MRVFIAIDTPEKVKAEIERLQNGLKKTTDLIRYVRPEGIHITLKFLGEVNEEELPYISSAILKAIKDTPCFKVLVDGIGGFPSLVAPRVIWIGIKEGEGIKRIAKRVEEELCVFGYPKEQREFTPHLTIGRIKKPRKDKGLERFLTNYSFPSLEMEVKEVKLMQSHLTPQGAIYTTLKEFRLGGEDEGRKR